MWARLFLIFHSLSYLQGATEALNVVQTRLADALRDLNSSEVQCQQQYAAVQALQQQIQLSTDISAILRTQIQAATMDRDRAIAEAKDLARRFQDVENALETFGKCSRQDAERLRSQNAALQSSSAVNEQLATENEMLRARLATFTTDHNKLTQACLDATRKEDAGRYAYIIYFSASLLYAA